MTNLTAHVVVRDEPFVYYAVKSVYDYVDRILLCDTGSTDFTVKDIELLLSEDSEGKISFSRVSLGAVMAWKTKEVARLSWHKKGRTRFLSGVAKIRQEQIDDTKTDYFLIVDGDEVHYKLGIQRVVNQIIPSWPDDKLCCYLPVVWFSKLRETYRNISYTGRVFKTDGVVMTGMFPNELHAEKETRLYLNHYRDNQKIFIGDQVIPFTHFSRYLKPWREPIRHRRRFLGAYPEVMEENPQFLERYIEIRNRKEVL